MARVLPHQPASHPDPQGYRHGVEALVASEQALLLDLSASMMRIERDATRAVRQRVALAWKSIVVAAPPLYGRVCSHPAGESSHASCRPVAAG
jgi:hypothetical protein